MIDAQRAELGRQLCALCGGGRREALPQATVGGFDAQLPPRLGIHEEEVAYVGQLLRLGSLISMAIISWRLESGASVFSSFADRGSRRRPQRAHAGTQDGRFESGPRPGRSRRVLRDRASAVIISGPVRPIPAAPGEQCLRIAISEGGCADAVAAPS